MNQYSLELAIANTINQAQLANAEAQATIANSHYLSTWVLDEWKV